MAVIIRSDTLANSGTITGEIAQAWSVTPHRRVGFQISVFGANLSGFLPGLGNDNTPQSWNIAITTPEGFDDGAVAAPLVAGFGDLGTLDIGGDWSVSVDVDACLDNGAEAPPDIDNGVFQMPPGADFGIYYQLHVGGAATVTLNSGGLTLTHTETITTAIPVTEAIGITLTAYTADAEYQIPDAPYYAHDAEGYTAHITASHAEGGLTESGGGVDCNNADGAKIVLGSPSTTVSLFGQVINLTYRPRTFALTGKANSVAEGYPDSIDYVCSRFLGDTSPGFTGGASFNRDGSQARYTASVSGRKECDNTGSGGSSLFSESADVNEWQAVSVTLDSDWCDLNGEYVTYTTDSGTHTLRNSLIYMQGWLFDGLTITQAAETVIDDCTATTDWTGMATGGGGLQNTGTSATKTLDTNFSGYAYLRINAKCASGTAARTLSINGKIWAVPLTATAANIDIDLLNPATGGATTDTTETKWPLDVDAHDTTNGPLEGVSYLTGLTLSGMDAAHPDTFTSISLVRKTGTQVSVMEAWAPRAATDQPQFSPEVENDSGQITTTYANRGIVALTDGRQSLEEWFHVHDHIQPISGFDSWTQRPQSIAGLAGAINGIPGWGATVSAPANDSSGNLHDGFLNADSPACWLWGAGLFYAGGETGFASGVGLTLSDGGISLSARPLFTTLTSWPGGIGDIFEVGDGTEPDGAIVLRAFKVLRAQAHGALLKNGGGRKDGEIVTLTPAAGELQSDTVSVGSATSGTDGSFRATGDGLIGYTGGAGGSSGVVASGTRSATQSFKSAWLGWVALRVLEALAGRFPSNAHSRFGPYHAVNVGAAGGIVYSRSDGATPWTATGGYAITNLSVPADTDATDTEPRLTVGADSRLWLTFTRPADGVRQAFSDDGGASWSDSVSLISGGTHPASCVTPTGTQVFAAYSGGSLVGRVQHPGDTAPASAVTLTDDTGTVLSVEDDSFGLSAGHAGSAPLLLHCLIVGESDTSDWVCHDEAGLTFTRVT